MTVWLEKNSIKSILKITTEVFIESNTNFLRAMITNIIYDFRLLIDHFQYVYDGNVHNDKKCFYEEMPNYDEAQWEDFVIPQIKFEDTQIYFLSYILKILKKLMYKNIYPWYFEIEA